MTNSRAAPVPQMGAMASTDALWDVAESIVRLVSTAFKSGQSQKFQWRMNLDGEERTYLGCVIPTNEGEVIAVVREAAVRERSLEDQARAKLRNERQTLRNPYQLTFRELAILQLLAEGATDKEIANELTISVFTASKHVSNILGKMSASSRTEASVRALQEGLLA